jgi:hypothetical protein
LPQVQLNVVFHGLFVFIERPGSIDVLAPDMGADHVYRAGEWLGETTYGPGSYQLQIPNSSPGQAVFDPDRNLKIRRARPTTAKKGVYARFSFPRPQAIRSLRSVTLPAAVLDTDPAVPLSSRTASVLQVLTYTMPSLSGLDFGPIPVPRAAQTVKGVRSASLHIIAGPDQRETAEHTIDGFHSAVNLLPSLRGKLRLQGAPQAPPLEAADVPPGCHKLEFLDLSDRLQQLARFGGKLRAANPPSSKSILSAPSGAGLMDTDVRVCVGIISELDS